MGNYLAVDLGNEGDGQLPGPPERINNQMLPAVAVGYGGESFDRDSLDPRNIVRRFRPDSHRHDCMLAVGSARGKMASVRVRLS